MIFVPNSNSIAALEITMKQLFVRRRPYPFLSLPPKNSGQQQNSELVFRKVQRNCRDGLLSSRFAPLLIRIVVTVSIGAAAGAVGELVADAGCNFPLFRIPAVAVVCGEYIFTHPHPHRPSSTTSAPSVSICTRPPHSAVIACWTQ